MGKKMETTIIYWDTFIPRKKEVLLMQGRIELEVYPRNSPRGRLQPSSGVWMLSAMFVRFRFFFERSAHAPVN